MASWELGQGQIPSLGERVEHRGLLYHDCALYDDDNDEYNHKLNEDDDDYVGMINKSIYENGDKDKWG